MSENDKENFSHFKGKDALKHIAEVQACGIVTSSEIHGAETPGSYFAGFDAARETALVLLLMSLLTQFFEFTTWQMLCFFAAFSIGLIFWKFGRSCWLAWARLERLHRIVDEEQREILENRPQERVELTALYRAKGFEGALLEEVIDVLMADGDRLLRVMLQEELGFRLEENEHPIIQGLGAAIGTFLSASIAVIGYYFLNVPGLLFGALFVVSLSAAFSAYKERNQVVSAIIWNAGLAVFTYAVSYYFMQFFVQ